MFNKLHRIYSTLLPLVFILMGGWYFSSTHPGQIIALNPLALWYCLVFLGLGTLQGVCVPFLTISLYLDYTPDQKRKSVLKLLVLWGVTYLLMCILLGTWGDFRLLFITASQLTANLVGYHISRYQKEETR